MMVPQSAAYNGMQKRILDKNLRLHYININIYISLYIYIYIKCAAHNLVLNNAFGAVKWVYALFMILQELYIFWGDTVNKDEIC